MVFETIQAGLPDPMDILKRSADGDLTSAKVDIGVGIYRNESGLYQELTCVSKAKLDLAAANIGHDYEITTGNKEFLRKAAQVMFGDGNIPSDQLASVQTISGTGAVHLAALFIAHCISPLVQVYVGTPTWGNYRPQLELVGLQVLEYSYYDTATRTYNHESTVKAMRDAPPASVFVLQGCCHNPTGVDPSPDQWEEIADAVEAGGHIALLDVAYQGLGRGIDEDAFAVRLFARRGLEMLVCQSFSKNFAIYGERCGALHVACRDGKTAASVYDRLRCLIRWEFSSSPIFGSRVVKTVLGDDALTENWKSELASMRRRIQDLRAQLFVQLTQVLQTPGDWTHITREQGLFSYMRLNPDQCRMLVNEHHIYLPGNGRINISGLNQKNLDRVARAIDHVIRSEEQARPSVQPRLA